MGRSSKVMTPRNVDLPMHVIRGNNSSMAINGSLKNPAKKPEHPRKKCVCLTSWLVGLILLCIAVIILASMLLPASSVDKNNFVDMSSAVSDTCLEASGLSLEQKAVLSDAIVVGKMEEEGIRVQKVLKGGNRVARKLVMREDKCEKEVEGKKKAIMFLQGDQNGGAWAQKFKAIPASDKVADVIKNLVEKKEDEATVAVAGFGAGITDDAQKGRRGKKWWLFSWWLEQRFCVFQWGRRKTSAENIWKESKVAG